MARKPRLHVPGAFYHVTLRGNHRQPVFVEPADRAWLESAVAHCTAETGTRVHAYCWMTNHIHLLVEVGQVPLGVLMQRVASPYARHMQQRTGTTGHFFERRHHAEIVDTERYLLAAIRYMHFNPVRGGLVARPADYAWSSHRCYLGLEQRPWVTTAFALGMLGATVADARAAYREFMAEETGGVSPLRAERRVDPRIAGDPRFVRALVKIASAVERSAQTLDQLIAKTCREFGVAEAAVRSTSRERRLTVARAAIAHRAASEGIATLSDVARALGRSVSAISRLLSRTRRRPGEPATLSADCRDFVRRGRPISQ
jgi:REP element-mobilizing transposase RayT